jgi:hypothetical protein
VSSFWFIIKQQWTIEEISNFSNSSHLEWRAELSDTFWNGTTQELSQPNLKFFFQSIYTDYTNLTYFDKISPLNLLLWNSWTKLKQIWLGWSLGGPLSILCPTVKMAAVTKNRNFFSCQFLLYYKSKWTQILTAATCQWVV